MYPIQGKHLNLSHVVWVELIENPIKNPHFSSHPDKDWHAFSVRPANEHREVFLFETTELARAAHVEFLAAMVKAGH